MHFVWNILSCEVISPAKLREKSYRGRYDMRDKSYRGRYDMRDKSYRGRYDMRDKVVYTVELMIVNDYSLYDL